MGGTGARRAVWVRLLVGSLAVLLPAGAWAAIARQPGPSTTIAAGRQAGATGFGATALVDEAEAPSSSTTLTVVAPASVSTSAPAPATTTSRPPAKPATTTTTVAGTRTIATLPPGVPWPATPPPTGIPNIPPATSWDVENDGVRAHMWIEPTAPIAGQAVRFRIDYSSAQPCCMVMLDFGDGSGYGLNTSRTCGEPSPLSPGPHSTSTTHTYAAAGAYKASLSVMAKDLCPQGPIPPGSSPPPPDFDAVSATACIAIGPGTAGQKGCSPFPPFAPDQLVSPVIDPFCQVRSDCTQASTPRPGWDA